ncbi:MAG: sulfate adenylyltransferase subunit CysN [Bryobacterales bacterium]|nr:sulfate adenylyltransferase subunit CysN [Bryobacterales bacterium]
MAALNQPALLPVSHFLAGDGEKDLLRFTTAGSVDDGKSTLIGRLLHDTNGAYEDQIEAVRKSKVNRSTGAFDFSLLTDGLKAEREQGITIDVAYRYFATPRRKFIIADTPGHEQYTRNMATGASTADLAIILVDARQGVLAQTRRHAYISWLLGIEHLVVTVNKMDLVEYSAARFEEIRAELDALAGHLPGATLHYIPVSALEGDNVVARSANTPWHDGPSLLELLENVEIARYTPTKAFRFPVQYVVRPDLDFRGFAGQVASGTVQPGDSLVALPSGQQATVDRIVTFDGDLEEAFAPMAVTLKLDREIDLSRGDVLIKAAEAPPSVSRHLEATLVWMSPEPLHAERTYLLRHGSRELSARIGQIHHRVDIETYGEIPATGLSMNEIARVVIETASPLYVDPYREIHAMGAVVLVDAISNNTVAAGMISHARPDQAAERRKRQGAVAFQLARVTPLERQHRHGHHGAVLLAEDQALAESIDRAFFDRGWQSLLVENDAVDLRTPPSWLKAALDGANLVVLTGALPGGAPEVTHLWGDYPVITAKLRDTLESSTRKAVAALAAHRVVPADEQTGDGEGI